MRPHCFILFGCSRYVHFPNVMKTIPEVKCAQSTRFNNHRLSQLNDVWWEREHMPAYFMFHSFYYFFNYSIRNHFGIKKNSQYVFINNFWLNFNFIFRATLIQFIAITIIKCSIYYKNNNHRSKTPECININDLNASVLLLKLSNELPAACVISYAAEQLQNVHIKYGINEW